MKNADGNENIRHKHIKAKHGKKKVSLLILKAKRRKTEEKFLVNYETKKRKEEEGFNIVMSNLKFKHNKSGFHKILRSTKKNRENKKKFCLLNDFFAAQKLFHFAFSSLCNARSLSCCFGVLLSKSFEKYIKSEPV